MMDFFLNGCSDRNIKLNGLQRSTYPTRDVLVTRTSNGGCNFSGFSKPKDQYADCFIDKNNIPMDILNNAAILATGTLGLAYPKTREAMEYAVDQVNNNQQVGNYPAADTIPGIGYVDSVHVEGGRYNSHYVGQQGFVNGNGTKAPATTKKGVQSKVFVDLNWRPVFFDDPVSAKMMIEQYVQKAHYLKVTAEEATWLTGINHEEAFRKPQLLFNHFPGLKLVLISNGRHGASYAYQHNGKVGSNVRPAFNIKPVDTTGAGDSFNSGFMSFLLQNF